MTAAEKTKIANTSGTNTGDQDLSDYQVTSEKGSANGYAPLDSSSLVPAVNLPSYVDDVLEYANLAGFPATGEDSKIYVTEDTNLTYRWTGTVYVEISASLALGETSASAYRGDRGKTAYDHSQVVHDKALVGLGNVDNTSDLTKHNNTDLTGTPTAPTPADNTTPTAIATTDYVETHAGEAAETAYTSQTISSNLTLDVNTEYETGKGLIVNDGVTLAVPFTSKLIVKEYSAGKLL